MNASIVDAILRIDACFNPELRRISTPDDLTDIYRAKACMKRMLNDAAVYLPPSNGKTLLNRVVAYFNSFVRCFATPDLLLSPLPTLVSAQRLSHNRQFDSFWGILNLFSSFDKRTIEAAFIALAEQFEQLRDEFYYLGFPSLLEGLAIIKAFFETIGGPLLANQRALSSVYLYLIKLLQQMFLQQPLQAETPAEYYSALAVYLANKYPDGFDRIYSQLRSSYMHVAGVDYRKELLCISEDNFITNAAPFRVDRLFQDHFVSQPVEKQRDAACAFYAIINYVLNVYVEVFVLTGESNIEIGLLHMHDTVYKSEALARIDDSGSDEFLEMENAQLVPSQMAIISELQDQQGRCPQRQSPEPDIAEAEPAEGVSIARASVLCGYYGNDLVTYTRQLLARKRELTKRRQVAHLAVDKFVYQHLNAQATMQNLQTQLSHILAQTVERIEEGRNSRIQPAEIVEILTGNLGSIRFEQFPEVRDIYLDKFGTLSPIAAAMRVLAALQRKNLESERLRNPPNVELLISEFKQLQLEIKVKQLSLQLSRTDVMVITAKAVVEGRYFYREREALFAKFGIAGHTTPEQVMFNSLQLAYVEKTRFTEYFENLSACACGTLQNVVAKMVRLIGYMLAAGLEFCIEQPSDVVKDSQSLSYIPVRHGSAVLLAGEMIDIEPGQLYAYFGMQVFVEIESPIVDVWVGGESCSFLV